MQAKIVGLGKMTGTFREQSPLNGVTSVAVMASGNNAKLNAAHSFLLGSMFPNAIEIDLSHMGLEMQFQNMCQSFGTRLTLTGGSNLSFAPFPAYEGSTKVTELYMDSFQFSASEDEASIYEGRWEVTHYYILRAFPNLERVSIKRATWVHAANPTMERGPVTQNMLIHFARHHPSLKWLRSDLTAENVEMLKQERPHIMFVSD